MAKTYKLENILDLKSYMKIAIDEKVEKDADGNYTFIAISSQASFEIGGFVGGFTKADENSDVYSDSTKYYIYRTDEQNIKGTVTLIY